MAIKKIKIDERVKVVSVMDDAIDEEAMGKESVTAYMENHDVKLLKFKKGEKPTYFIVKNVLPEEQADIQEDHFKITMPDLSKLKNPNDIKNARPKVEQVKSQTMLIKYFKAGVEAYEEDGKVFDKFDHNIFPPSVITEIGSFVLSRTQLGGDEKKS